MWLFSWLQKTATNITPKSAVSTWIRACRLLYHFPMLNEMLNHKQYLALNEIHKLLTWAWLSVTQLFIIPLSCTVEPSIKGTFTSSASWLCSTATGQRTNVPFWPCGPDAIHWWYHFSLQHINMYQAKFAERLASDNWKKICKIFQWMMMEWWMQIL